MKYITFVFVGIACFAPVLANALKITEVMYNPAGADEGREWLEVWNDTSQSVKLSELTFFEGGVNHKINFVSGSDDLMPGGYAVIAGNDEMFKSDWPAFSGGLFDSSFSLSNIKEIIEIRSGETTVAKVSYEGVVAGSGDGNSVGTVDGTWKANTPTPGGPNKSAPTGGGGATSTPPPTPKSSPIPPEAPPEAIEPPTDPMNMPPLPDSPQIQESEQNQHNFSWLHFVTILILVILGASAVYFLRRKKKTNSPGDDFQIEA